MKLTNEAILTLVESKALQTLNKVTTLPIDIIFQLVDMTQVIDKAMETLNKARQILLNKYAEQENGSYVFADETKTQVKLKDPEAYVKEFQELLKIEVELMFNKIEIKKSDLSKGTLSVQDIYILRTVITFVD